MLASNIPVKLESKPGAGKTSLIGSVHEDSNAYLKTMVAVNHDPTDFGGIPKTFDTFYELLPGKWALDLNAAAVDPAFTFATLFLDEINTAGRAVLAALLKVVDERIVGFQRLEPSIRIIMAMNPAEQNGGTDLTPAMANRVAHLPFEFPLKDWAQGMRTGFNGGKPITLPDPAEMDALTSKYRALVADFATSGAISAKEFEQYPEDQAKRSLAFPTRRTWTMAATALAGAEALGFDGNTQLICVTALVGKKAAEAFDDYLDTKNGMDPVAMLNDPENFPLPTNDDGLFTALDRMANTVIAGPTQGYVDAACIILMRVGSTRPGVAASGMRNIALFLRENRGFISDKAQEAIREFKPVIEAAGGMDA
jgi:hypothetical protein